MGRIRKSNLVSKSVPAGSSEFPLPGVNAAKNWLNGSSYDANGNVTTLNNATLAYDMENRLMSYTTWTFVENYAYDEGNRRVEKWNASGSDGMYFYGPDGKLLSVLQVNILGNSPWMTLSTVTNRVYFGGMLLGTSTGYANTDADLIKDRLGSAKPSYPYGTDIGAQAGEGDDFATYWKDSSTGLNYAQNRYYASTYGRFATPDPAIGSAASNNPQSWNRYSYVLNDPINSGDPQGLCSVLIAGITQNPDTNSTNTSDQAQEFANEVGAITAFPYAGGSKAGGVANVLAQGVGIPTGATYTALQAIALAAQNAGPISIYAFSGGAAAFTEAWKYLTTAVQSRIQSVTYIDPGTVTALQAGSGTVDVYDDVSDAANILVQMFGVGAAGSIPLNAQFHDTGSCGHNWSCVFQNYAAQLSQNASNCQTGAGGVFGAPSRTAVQFTPSFNGLVPVTVYWWEIPPIPWVTSKIHYDPL